MVLFKIKISDYVYDDLIPGIDDTVRLLIIFTVIQLLLYMSNSNFNNTNYSELFIYIIIANSLYWFIYKKLVELY